MTDLIDWLKAEATKIKEGIEFPRKYREFIGKVEFKEALRDKEVFYRLTMDNQVKSITKDTRTVDINLNKNWKDIHQQGYLMTWGCFTTELIRLEQSNIVNMISEESREVEIDNSLDFSTISKELTHGHPDTMLVNPYHYRYFRNNPDFRLFMDEEKNFYGKFGHLDVYWCLGVERDEFKIYEKRHTELVMTPLIVDFVPDPNPESLLVKEKYVSINLKPETLVNFKIKS